MKKLNLKCNSKNDLKGNVGITLIALVISIVVLLILAGVSLVTLTGDNGILKKVVEAKEKIETTQKDETNILIDFEESIYEYSTGITVTKVTDTNPGILEGSGTEEDPYIINSIEDLVFFSYDVANGNTYNNKTIKLGESLDFNSSKSYVDAMRTDYSKYGYIGELKTALTKRRRFSNYWDRYKFKG